MLLFYGRTIEYFKIVLIKIESELNLKSIEWVKPMNATASSADENFVFFCFFLLEKIKRFYEGCIKSKHLDLGISHDTWIQVIYSKQLM